MITVPKPRLNANQAQAALRIFVYSDLLLSALEDFHTHNPVLRRTLLKNRIGQLRTELADLLTKLYKANDGIEPDAELEFYDSINLIEQVHRKVYATPMEALGALDKTLDWFHQTVKQKQDEARRSV